MRALELMRMLSAAIEQHGDLTVLLDSGGMLEEAACLSHLPAFAASDSPAFILASVPDGLPLPFAAGCTHLQPESHGMAGSQ